MHSCITLPFLNWLLKVFIIFSGCKALLTTAWNNLPKAHTDKVQQQYLASFRLFMAFLMAIQVDVLETNFKHIIAFTQMLHNSKLSSATILNYLSGIKVCSTRLNVHLELDHPTVHQLIRAFAKHPHNVVQIKKIFTVDLLDQLISSTSILQHATAYKAIFLAAFHGFFRISNLLPVSSQSFDINKHLARGDIIFDQTIVHVIMKWSKTLQGGRGRVIQLAAIPGSQLCPVRALSDFVTTYPTPANKPFFTIGQTTITQPMARKALAQVLVALRLNPSQFPFHTFRHSGATLAFQLGVPLEHIQAHGTWSSDAVWAYLKTAPTRVAPSKISQHISST